MTPFAPVTNHTDHAVILSNKHTLKIDDKEVEGFKLLCASHVTLRKSTHEKCLILTFKVHNLQQEAFVALRRYNDKGPFWGKMLFHPQVDKGRYTVEDFNKYLEKLQ